MKRLFLSLLFLVALVVAHVALAKLARVHGLFPVLAVMATALLGAAWLSHTAESAAMAEDFRAALRECGLADKEVSFYLRIATSSVSEQLGGAEHLSMWRVASLPPEFHIAFAKRRLARFGTFTVLHEGALRELVARVEALTHDRQRRQGAA